jgi:hypothetical protein
MTILALLILLSLDSCATGGGKSSVFAPVYLTNRAGYFLLPPSGIQRPLDMAQQITGTYGKQEFIMDAWVAADENRMTIVFFNTLGVSLGELSFHEGGAAFSPARPAPLSGLPKAEYIIADFQFCFYRKESLAAALKKIGLELRVERRGPGEGEEGDAEIRRIFRGGKGIIEIIKRGDTVRYVNFLQGYAYTLRGDFHG